MPRYTYGCLTAYTWPIKNNTKIEMIYNHITPKYTHTNVKYLRKFSKIKINLRNVFKAFQVKIC